MTTDHNQHTLIDRLAAGEVDETSRRELFAWLDSEPSRWRRCALALLEAREVQQAFSAWQSELPPSKPAVFRAKARPSFQRGAIFALAASIVIAFMLGVFARGMLIAPAPQFADRPNGDRRRGAVDAARAEPSHQIAQPADKPSERRVAAVAQAASGGAPSDAVPPYLRSQLERRGYQVTSRQARLPVVLPDGRRMMVPVDQLQLNYVGQRTY